MNIALILSGGTGVRLGAGVPKQYISVQGKPIISYCIEKISAHAQIDAITIVADQKWQKDLKIWIKEADRTKKFRGFSQPGANRQMSILNGLEDISCYAEAEDVVLTHDAARPMLSDEQITACLTEIEGHDGILPVLPMKDTVYMSEDGKRVFSLMDRSKIFSGQAPESFVLGKYLEANRRLLPDRILKINGSTEPAVMAGMDIAMIAGDENNFKITTQADLNRFCGIVKERGNML